MDSPPTTTLPLQPFPKPGRRSKRGAESEEPVEKPKKVNSEIRKQQNRIASRNYREKRKRKLQYLQQLIQEGSNDREESEPSPERQESYTRSVSTDYDIAGPSSSPYMLPTNSDFNPMSPSSATISNEVLATTATPFSSHLATTHSYPVFPQIWTSPIYSPPPPANVTWNVPSTWTAGSNYPARVDPRPHMYHYTHSPTETFLEQAQTPSYRSRDFLTNPDLYGFSASYGVPDQTSGNPNVSLPTSSPYYQEHYPGSR
ncbi:hypothetical protein BDW02DRAFT_145357 [Decorospora gaudefroyi]|uniref:BZIP domain-containing protein n=1 Tax=Decorospora gaudefroyi TaxID=184978 RepID=A0A6A5JXH0_9PLEO|nr:hypothetical protein BDW02DRAFT_145357 [Decorospora gaudefroyi]